MLRLSIPVVAAFEGLLGGCEVRDRWWKIDAFTDREDHDSDKANVGDRGFQICALSQEMNERNSHGH